jgi:hypothetical protein
MVGRRSDNSKKPAFGKQKGPKGKAKEIKGRKRKEKISLLRA